MKPQCVQPSPDIQTLRNAIPKHCFVPSNAKSMTYILRDLGLISTTFALGLYIPSFHSFALRSLLWAIYGIVQGLFFTGLWILAHECGHGALFSPRSLNDVIGFPLHSMLLVPYFSWKFSHSRHHRYTNHMERDTVFVPCRENESSTTSSLLEMLHLSEDTPLTTIFVFMGHQLLGWPAYLMFNVSAGEHSLHKSVRSKSKKQSHFGMSDLFSPSEHPFVLLSNVGLAATLIALLHASKIYGAGNILLLYGMPYLWVNHWIVAITFLHHTHENAPHYDASEWTYQRGALATVDREFGFIGRHIFHHIIEHHVIHHLFPRIPFYSAEEATEHVIPLLGSIYLREQSSFWKALWHAFVRCRYVVESNSTKGMFVWAN